MVAIDQHYILTADGQVFDANISKLGASPAGVAVVPAEPRNPQASWSELMKQLGDDKHCTTKTRDSIARDARSSV